MKKLRRDEIIEKIQLGVSLTGVDMSGIDLRGTDLSGTDLSGTNLSEADLGKATLRGANLSEADLREANLSEADLIRAMLIKTDLSGANLRGADLRGANLRGAILVKAILREADLRGAGLSEAILRGANLHRANLHGANPYGANLSEANLSEANLSEADLGKATLRGANLRGADLRETNLREADLSEAFLENLDLSGAGLYGMKLRERDLVGVKYRPEQLSSIIIVQQKRKSPIVSQEKGVVVVRFASENPPLLHLIYLAAFIEYQYDILYVFLFSQYESVEKLTRALSGSPYHWLKDKDEAIKIVRMSKKSEPILVFEGIDTVWKIILALFSFFTLIPKGARADFYKCLRQAIYKTKEENLKEKKLEAEIMNEYANLIKKSREIRVDPPDLISPGVESKKLPPALIDQKLSSRLEQEKNYLETRAPRVDFVKSILLLSTEGLLVSKITPQELANLLEILVEHFGRDFDSLRSQIGDFQIDREKGQ